MEVLKVQNQMQQIKELFEAGILSQEDFAKYESKLQQQLAELKPVVEPVEPVVVHDPTIPQVGDILCCSWGYNMTLVDFYKVVKITPSGKSVSVIQLGSECVDGEAGYYGHVMPTKDEYGPVIKNKRIANWGDGYSIKISSCQHASTWNGKKQYFNKMD